MLDFALGEFWQTKPGGFELVGLFSPQPLFVSLLDGSQRMVELEMARAYAGQHQLSLRLCVEAATSRRLQFAHDVGGDDFVRQVNFPLRSAFAVPVVVDAAQSKAAYGVIILYSSRTGQVSGYSID